MVARPKELLQELRTGDTVKALKAIKNQVIGNKTRKAAFLTEGAIEQVLEVLKTCQHGSSGPQVGLVQQQAAVVIGSLTYGTESGLRQLAAHQGMPYLVSMLDAADEAVVEAGLRAIKMVLQQSTALPSYLAATSDVSASSGLDLPPPPSPASTAATAVRLDAPGVSAVVGCLCRIQGLSPTHFQQEAGSGADAVANPESGSAMECEPASTSEPGPGVEPGSGSGSDPGSAARAQPGSAVAGPAGPMGPTGEQAAAAYLGTRGAALAALSAAVVACCCRREEERALAISAGAPLALLQLLLGIERPDTLISALEGLSLMLPRHPPSCELALARPGVYGKLLTLLRDPAPVVRLLAASCVATLSRAPGCSQPEAMQRAALPVLLRLLAQPSTRPHVPAVLARLIEASEALQKAAADADTVRLLAGLLAAEAAPQAAQAITAAPPTAAPAAAPSPSAAAAAMAGSASASSSDPACALREGCLRALGSLCLNRDDSRKQLLEAKVLRHIVRSLEDPADGVRAAAALCVRALSRCVRTLRGGLLEGGGELAPVLVGLLGDGNEDVQASAAAALCNLVLDFSAVKSAVLAAGGLPRLAALAAPGRPQALRLHAVWALANMLYRSDQAVRTQMMQALPWPRLRQLLHDSDSGVVEQALVVLRNLCMGDRTQIHAAVHWAAASSPSPSSSSAGAEAAAEEEEEETEAGGVSGRAGKEAAGQGLLDVLQRSIEAARGLGAAATEGEGPARVSDRAPSTSPSPRAGSDSPSTGSPAPTSTSSPASQRLAQHATHGLYTVANLLTGGPAVKDAVAGRRALLVAVVAFLRPEAGELALPAVWCAINLAWPCGPGAGAGAGAEREGRAEAEAVAERCRALLDLGAAERLEELQRRHPSRDVQERARTALEQLRKGVGAGAQTGASGGERGMAGVYGLRDGIFHPVPQ